MTKKLLTVGTILILIALVAMAADAITGKWTMEQPGRNGGAPRVSTFDLKADGAKLTGTMTAAMGGGGGGGQAPAPAPITNGKVDGMNISFEVTRDFGGNSMTTKYEGAVSGSDMKLKVTRTGQDGTPMTTDATAKKSTTTAVCVCLELAGRKARWPATVLDRGLAAPQGRTARFFCFSAKCLRFPADFGGRG
jgi:hypothetical protein